LKRDEFKSNHHPASTFCLRMIQKPFRAFVEMASVALILSNGSPASLAFAGRKRLFARHSCAYGV
ncbi:hypothetical protein, partial [Brucella sp. BO2]|uniref:hypothetical protein n=1 Tax=Brucella sp. BO2 TaxID=693750 RepID=UPI001AEBEB13